jgi:hypothetical protein
MRTVMAALTIMILPVAMVAQVTDADGWNGAKWGMTLEQVKAATTCPLERHTYFLKAGTPRYQLKTVEPFKLLDVPVRAIFSFSPDEKLVGVLIQVESVFLEWTHSQSELFDRFKQSLTEEYGKPKFTDDKGRSVFWRLPSTAIRLQWTGGSFMGLTYEQANKKSTELEIEVGPVLTLRAVP